MLSTGPVSGLAHDQLQLKPPGPSQGCTPVAWIRSPRFPKGAHRCGAAQDSYLLHEHPAVLRFHRDSLAERKPWPVCSCSSFPFSWRPCPAWRHRPATAPRHRWIREETKSQRVRGWHPFPCRVPGRRFRQREPRDRCPYRASGSASSLNTSSRMMRSVASSRYSRSASASWLYSGQRRSSTKLGTTISMTVVRRCPCRR